MEPDTIYEWIRQFSKGDIIALFLMGVAMFTYHKLVTRKMLNWMQSRPPVESLLTKDEHALICKTTLLEIKNLILESRAINTKEVSGLKELLMVTMRADILEALRNSNKVKT